MIMEVMEVIKKLLLKYAPFIINQIHFLDQVFSKPWILFIAFKNQL